MTTSLAAAACCCCASHHRLALQVHPDKVTLNGHEAYKPVFDEAFKVLGSANDLLTRVASGEAIPGLTQQQGAAAAAAAGAAACGFAGGAGGFPGGFPGAGFPGGFPNGFPGGFPGAAGAGAAGAGGQRYYYAYVPPGSNPYGTYAGAWAPRR
jgi:hypothetical protein